LDVRRCRPTMAPGMGSANAQTIPTEKVCAISVRDRTDNHPQMGVVSFARGRGRDT